MSSNFLLGAKYTLTACAAVAVVQNLLVIAVLASTKYLRNKHYGFVFNLALADLVCAVFGIAFSLKDLDILFAFFITGYFVAIWTILTVAINRYLTLILMPPVRYDSLVTKTRLVGVCVVIWAVSLFIEVFPVYVASDDVYIVIEGVVKPIGVFIIWLITATLYFIVFRKVNRHTPAVDASLMTEQIDKQVRQTRSLLLTFCVILVTSFVCWMPFSILEMTLYFNPDLEFDEAFYWLSGVIYVLSTIINPLIYLWRLDSFKRGAKALFCRCFVQTETTGAEVEHAYEQTVTDNVV